MMLSGTNLPRVGTYNVNVVLSTIQASRGISRVEIAKRTGLTAQTVSVIVRRLIEQGIVEESGSVPSAGGKPRIALRINPAAAYAVGIHFDPIEISIVVVDMAGHPLAHSRQQIAFGSEPEVLITQAAKVVQRLLADLQIPEDRVLGVGAACPGPIDQDEGQVISLPRHDHWTDVPIKRLLTDYVGFDVIVDNDANAAAHRGALVGLWPGLLRFRLSLPRYWHRRSDVPVEPYLSRHFPERGRVRAYSGRT